jgi:hypothetical protein
MKFLLSLAAVAVTCTGLAQGTLEAIVGYSASYSAYISGVTAGWTFQPATSISAIELGCFDKVFGDNPGVTSIQVGLWNDSGSLLASSWITPGSALSNQTRYESITPVSLDPGQIYHLGAYYSGSGIGIDVAGVAAGGTVSNSVAIQLRGTALATSGFAFPGEVAGTLGSLYAGPNFRFLDRVPEPSSCLLLGLGGLLLAARRRNQRS